MHRLLTLTILASYIIVSGTAHAAEDTSNLASKVQTKQEGPSEYLVTCFESPQYCAEEFKRLCPDGHRVEGYFRAEYDHGQITARISCVVPQGN